MKTEIIKRRGMYCVRINQGAQSFHLDYKSEREDEAEWMASMFDYALNEFKNESIREFIDWHNKECPIQHIPNSRIGRFNLEKQK